MLTDKRRQEIANLFCQEVEGGVCKDFMQIVEGFIENEDMTPEEFDDNELEIAYIFDDGWFTCSQCGWTMPVCEMGEDVNAEFVCQSCED